MNEGILIPSLDGSEKLQEFTSVTFLVVLLHCVGTRASTGHSTLVLMSCFENKHFQKSGLNY